MTSIPTDGLNDAKSDAVRTMPRGHAERFYDRLRNQIHAHLEAGGPVIEKLGDFLLLVPDVFILLWRLLNDSRVSGKNKVLLGSGVAYFIFPFDIVPEAILGPIGYLDDLVFGAYVLNKMLSDTDVAILREHWSGHEDLLDTIRKVLESADKLVAGDLIKRLKRMVGV
ncbi:MAG TPA: DUF1232 domain-containing protein [Thermoanaerobaculia bacterium]